MLIDIELVACEYITFSPRLSGIYGVVFGIPLYHVPLFIEFMKGALDTGRPVSKIAWCKNITDKHVLLLMRHYEKRVNHPLYVANMLHMMDRVKKFTDVQINAIIDDIVENKTEYIWNRLMGKIFRIILSQGIIIRRYSFNISVMNYENTRIYMECVGLSLMDDFDLKSHIVRCKFGTLVMPYLTIIGRNMLKDIG